MAQVSNAFADLDTTPVEHAVKDALVVVRRLQVAVKGDLLTPDDAKGLLVAHAAKASAKGFAPAALVLTQAAELL